MIPTAAYSLLADMFTGEGSDWVNKVRIGSGYTAESANDTGLASELSGSGFDPVTVDATYAGGVLTYTHEFTNSSASARTVREVGLFSSSGILVYRKVFPETALPNFGIVPAGKKITLIVRLIFNDSPAVAVTAGSAISPINMNIYISGSASCTMDISTFDLPAPICFNGIKLPNAGIPKFKEALGAKSWTFTCSTQDYDEVLALLPFAGPIQTGNSITGRQYVVSAYRAGVLAIKNYSSGSYDSFPNSYIQGPIEIENFGENYLFEVTVFQSAYDEEVP